MSENPYQSPAAELNRPADPGANQLHEPRALSAGRGAAWVSEGLALFMKSPVMLGVMGIVFILLAGVVSLIPFLGALAVGLFWPHANAGFYLAFKHADQDQTVGVGDLFAPFKDMSGLLGLGGLYLAGSLVLMLVMGIVMVGGMGASGMFGMMSGDAVDPSSMDMGGMGITFLLGILVMLALSVPFGMAFLFAPVLVHQHGLPAMEAIKQSFNACLRNIVPFLIWSLIWFGVMILLGIVMMIPFLGVLLVILFGLIAMPLVLGNFYAAYRDIFID